MVVAGPDLLPNHGTVISTGTTRGVDRRASLGESVGRPPGAPKVLGSLMAVSGPNYGPAAHPRRGDEAPRRAAAPRHARPGRRVAAGAARPYRVTSERSRPPPAAAVPRLPAGPVGRGSRPHLPTSRRPCRTRQRRAIVRARRRRRGRRCEPASGGERRTWTSFYEVADPVKCLPLLLSFSSCVSMGSASRVSRGSSSFYSRSHWRARLAGA